MFRTRNITFEKVGIKATRRWRDKDGKKRQETKEFWQTISPFNKNTDGEPKTREEILVELREERNKWEIEEAAK